MWIRNAACVNARVNIELFGPVGAVFDSSQDSSPAASYPARIVVRLYLAKRTGYPANRPVGVRLSVRRKRGHRLTFGIPLKVAPKDWYDKHERLKPTVPRATEINAALRDWKAEVVQMIVEGKDDDAIRLRLLERAGRAPEPEPTEAPSSILERYEAHLSALSMRSASATVAAAKTARGYCADFLSDGGDTGSMTTQSPPSEIGPGFLQAFQSFLVTRELASSTTNKVVTRVKAFLSWLYERAEIPGVPPVRALSMPKNPPLYLTADEVERFAEADLTGLSPAHQDARDLFLVACSTGQRYSDVAGMTWQDVRSDTVEDDDGKPVEILTWLLTARKTSAQVRVPLVGPARRIVEARKEAGDSTPTPRLSNQQMNVCLRVICQRAGIDEPVTRTKIVGGERIRETRPKHDWITSHVGRKTFVTLALQSGVQAHELLGFTHDDLRTLQIYAGQNEAKRRDQLTTAFGGL